MMKMTATLALTLILAAAGCSKKDSDTKAKKPAKPTTTQKQTGNAGNMPATKPGPAADVADVLKTYEAIRALLAADNTAGVAEHAKTLAAQAGSANAPAPAKAALTQLAGAADALAKAPAADIGAVRMRFGHVSKAVVALLDASPADAKSYHVFECPMAKGYKRWAQPNAKLENPYMGKEMLACGSEVKRPGTGTP